jgi:hypothetical protein
VTRERELRPGTASPEVLVLRARALEVMALEVLAPRVKALGVLALGVLALGVPSLRVPAGLRCSTWEGSSSHTGCVGT